MKTNAMWWIKWTLISIALYIMAKGQADAWRGYQAAGGELLILALPFFLKAIQSTISDWVRLAKEIVGVQE